MTGCCGGGGGGSEDTRLGNRLLRSALALRKPLHAQARTIHERHRQHAAGAFADPHCGKKGTPSAPLEKRETELRGGGGRRWRRETRRRVALQEGAAFPYAMAATSFSFDDDNKRPPRTQPRQTGFQRSDDFSTSPYTRRGVSCQCRRSIFQESSGFRVTVAGVSRWY